MRLWRWMLIGWMLLAAGQTPAPAMDHADHQPAFSSVNADHSQHDSHCARAGDGETPPSDADCCASPTCCNPLFSVVVEPLIDVDTIDGATGRRLIDLLSFSSPPIVPPPRG